MTFKGQCHKRRRLMCLEAAAARATGMIGHCTTPTNNAYWQVRADRLLDLADTQYNHLILEIERDATPTQTQPRRNTPSESHQTAPTRPMAQPVANHTEAGTTRSPARLADEPRRFDDLGRIEAF